METIADRTIIDAVTAQTISLVERILATTEGLGKDGINWKPPGIDQNSIYILAFHTMGNVRQNYLAVLGGGPDDRDRDAEFKVVGESAEDLFNQWAELKPQVLAAAESFSSVELETDYDHPRRGRMTGLDVLLLAATHASEHAGHCEMICHLDGIPRA